MLGTDTYNTTDLQYVLTEVWSPRINDIFRSHLVASKLFWNVSDLVSQEGRFVHVPTFTTEFTAKTQATPGAEVELQSPAGTETKLEIDTWKYAALMIAKHQQVMYMKSIDLQAKLVDQAAYAIAKAFDTSLMSLYTGLSQSVGDSASNLSDATIREAVEKLDAKDVPFNDRAFIVHPNVFHEDIMGISKFYDPNAFERGQAPVTTGRFGGVAITDQAAASKKGTLYGIDLYTTTQVVKALDCYYNLLIQKDVFAYACPTGGVDIASEYKLENLGTLMVADLIYGVKENRDECGVVIMAETGGSFVS